MPVGVEVGEQAGLTLVGQKTGSLAIGFLPRSWPP